MAKKILLDTDSGSDIDDAVCLSYLLANSECELLGITTVTGEGEKRARMASALCNIVGKQIPILIGSETPLLVKQRQSIAPQAAVLSGLEHDVGFPRGEATPFLREIIKKNPGEITLLTIGPLTNIALLFKSDPEIPHLLKDLVMMCGTFMSERVEWNTILDPHASAIVYSTHVKKHKSIGTDVTFQVSMPGEEVRHNFKHPLLQLVLDFADIWFENRETIFFHDPLAAATIFDENICYFDRGEVKIELNENETTGRTHWEKVSQGVHEVAITVDQDRFFEHFF